jgi:hypothetical protein
MKKYDKVIKALQICSHAGECTPEQHYGCPYGDDGVIDCVDRLKQDLRAAVEDITVQLNLEAPCYNCPNRLKENCRMYGCVFTTAAELLKALAGGEKE